MAKNESIRWTDVDIENLLECVKEFKAQKEYEGVDWESVKDKYEIIRSLFLKNRGGEGSDDKYTRDKISSKVKAIRGNYREAVDSGRQSGGGRVVATFYDLCNEIWAGAPATESIMSGVESSTNNAVNNDDNVGQRDDEIDDDGVNESGLLESPSQDEEMKENADILLNTNPTTYREQRVETAEPSTRSEAMTKFLKERRNKKIEKKLPKISIEQQLLDVTKEEFAFKKQLFTNMSKQETHFNEAMTGMQQSFANFTDTMAMTFGSLMRMMAPHPSQSQPWGSPTQGSHTQGSHTYFSQAPGSQAQADGPHAHSRLSQASGMHVAHGSNTEGSHPHSHLSQASASHASGPQRLQSPGSQTYGSPPLGSLTSESRLFGSPPLHEPSDAQTTRYKPYTIPRRDCDEGSDDNNY